MISNWHAPVTFEVALTAKFSEQIVSMRFQCVEHAIKTNNM